MNINSQEQPMIALKYIPKSERFLAQSDDMNKYNSHFSEVMDKIKLALPISCNERMYTIQGLAVVETRAHFDIPSRCWVTTHNKYPKQKIYKDGGQNV